MGSGGPQKVYWTTPDAYDHLFNQLVPAPSLAPFAQADVRLVNAFGYIYLTGTVELEPWYTFTGPAPAPVTSNYMIEAVDALSNTLASQRMGVSFSPHSTPKGMPVRDINPAPFEAAVPFPDGTAAFRIISGTTIQEGDIVLGLASSGAHSNGYSLIRKIIENNRIDLSADFHGKTLADTIMTPTRIYVKPLLELIKQLPVKGLAHITGGGLVENVPRILPDQVMAVLQKDAWAMPPLFHWLQQQGNVADHEMARVFNCGIGMVIVVAPDHTENALRSLRASGETVWQIGEIKPRINNQAATVLV